MEVSEGGMLEMFGLHGGRRRRVEDEEQEARVLQWGTSTSTSTARATRAHGETATWMSLWCKTVFDRVECASISVVMPVIIQDARFKSPATWVTWRLISRGVIRARCLLIPPSRAVVPASIHPIASHIAPLRTRLSGAVAPPSLFITGSPGVVLSRVCTFRGMKEEHSYFTLPTNTL
ncbi:hypothetical protein P153DRAFT_80448 [Dothidotthia symphoricarpi CBS 119687]|uniref:Uncharacterized protein n=1 Tax=Dothidotthia symphoricarpi CBS 119687 TaxID=1392245 RepID=A0A6A6A715_9PLEO|nr:uncharacterized protein P153DRAFT_80448 [Dothidotthia symphoricarpi CBS 119687]KAF2126578.1 hypothetical protein P153DRAFT_80448 [Dothidotthia symphoricarpi CBS 119687]